MNFNQNEFLLANHLGGYASSTLCGSNTRSYHGLLVAANADLSQRMVYLSKFEEQLLYRDEEFSLSTNQWPDVIYPTGFQWIKSVEATAEQVQWVYAVGSREVLKKTIKIIDGQNTLMLAYQNLANTRIKIKLTPLVAFRNYHHVYAESGQHLHAMASDADVLVRSNLYEEYLKFSFSDPGSCDFQSHWYSNFIYARERERGLGFQENLLAPFCYEAQLGVEQKLFVTVALETPTINLQSHVMLPNLVHSVFPKIFSHARDFVVKSGGHTKVLAGYHWFTNWGRDTLIAMPGLLTANGFFGEAKEILEELLSQTHRGLLYNVFTEGGGYQYHSADASLLLFNALYDYIQKSGDSEFFKKYQPKLKEILDFYISGSEFNIKLDENFLLHAGATGLALTWMDAKVEGVPVTQRAGYAIDLNALFYNALCVYDALAEQSHCETAFQDLREKVLRAIQENFYREGAVADFISREGVANWQLRPNQLWSVALPFKVFSKAQAQKILEVINLFLVTPMGLRTLSPQDKNYVGQYGGDSTQRDSAYHQGTVWPWLWGIYGDAVEYAYTRKSPEFEKFKKLIMKFAEMIERDYGGLVPEIFSGDDPHAAAGCIHQAWSSGELIRLLRKFEL